MTWASEVIVVRVESVVIALLKDVQAAPQFDIALLVRVVVEPRSLSAGGRR